MITLNVAVVLGAAILAGVIITVQSVKAGILKKRLNDALVGTQKRNIQLSYLIESSQKLSSVLSKNKLLRLIVETLGEITKSEKTSGLCALYVLDRNTNRYAYAAGFNMDVTMLSKPTFGMDEKPFKAFKKDSAVMFFEERENIKNVFFKSGNLRFLHDIDFGIVIPLVVENEVIGVIASFLPRTSFDFLKEDPHLLKALAGQLSMALGSALQSELAVLDRLTKVYNHAYFQGRLEQEIARSERYKYPVSLLMIDIDHFKEVNDTYGHQQGDELLKTIAEVIRFNIRIVDLCARYGGEEFAVIFPETDLISIFEEGKEKSSEETGGAMAKAESLRRLISDTVIETPSGKRIKVTASIGIGVKKFPHDKGTTKDALIKEADQQLYRAKEEGRNRVCYVEDKASKASQDRAEI